MDQFKNIYLVGIGGIGMSALARYFYTQGTNVLGYDKTPSPLTDELQKEGISISFDDEIYAEIKALQQENTLVIYTPAIPSSSLILQYFLGQNFTVQKRAEVLGDIVNQSKGLAIAGTHGKTTTSTMLAYILQYAEVPVNAFLGGISTNLKSNIITHANADYTVVEADEYDRSFHRLFPHAAVITSLDADHLDIYGTRTEMLKAFQIFANQVDASGWIACEEEVALAIQGKNKIIYGYGEQCDYQIVNRQFRNGFFDFEIILPNKDKVAITMGLPGIHNILNATAAFIMAVKVGVPAEKIADALSNFKGVARRFDVHIKTNDFVYIDDYAHHPGELENLISSVKEMYPLKKITLVFQPHLFSRTADFMDDFATVLSTVDELILMPIYPARELPMEGVTSDVLCDKVSLMHKKVVDKPDLIAQIKLNQPEVLITAGAGDIDRFVTKIIGGYEEKTV